MNKKSLIIFKVVLLSCLAVFLIGIMLYFMFSKLTFKNFYFEFKNVNNGKLVINEVYDVSKVEKINFNLKSADVDIKYSENNDIKLEVYDKKKDDVSIKLLDGSLELSYSNFSSVCIGFCFNSKKVILYLPEEFNKEIIVKSTSGEININKFVSNVSISTASGDVKLDGAKDAYVETASGDVFISETGVINIKTISGDIDIRNVSEINGSTTSGEANIYGLNGFIDFKSTSGDIELNDVVLNKNSKLSSVSGDIEINGINKVYVSTSSVSGDEDVYTSDRMSDIELSIKTTSGDIEVR